MILCIQGPCFLNLQSVQAHGSATERHRRYGKQGGEALVLGSF